MRGLFALAVGSSVVVLASALLIYLLFLGDRGNTIAGPGSLFVAITTLVVTILMGLLRSGVIAIPLTRWPRRLLRVIAYVVVLGALVATVVIVSVAFTDRQIPVTESVTVTGQADIRNGSVTSIAVSRPDRRSGLALRVRLVSRDPGVGNCVGSTTLAPELRLDGAPRAVLPPARPGDEMHFDVSGAQQSATVLLTVRTPRDQTCRFDLRVVEAYLYTFDPRAEPP